MSNRITQKDLEYLVTQINKATNSPIEQYTKNAEGKYKANPGNYHLSYAYGGVALERMANEGGGDRRISTGGYGTKRELYTWMQAFLSGLQNKANV